MSICRMQYCTSEEEGWETSELRMGRCSSLLKGGGEVSEWVEEDLRGSCDFVIPHACGRNKLFLAVASIC